MTETGAALERCVGDVRRFAEEHWGRRPLYRPAEDDSRLAGLLDLPDVDHLVTETLLRMPAFRLVKDGTPLDPASYTQTIRIGGSRVERTARPERVLDHFASGATIVLQALHRQWPPVARFCRDLELSLSHPVQANAYVTPPTSRGFALHHDTHDVFVLQTRGHKHWRVYAPVVELAGPEQRWSRSMGVASEPVLEAELGPGDCLYVPRGFPHDAEAREEVSVHVTVGILAYTWLDLWRHVMGSAPDHLPFREALPVGFAREPGAAAAQLPARLQELHRWLDGAASEESVAALARRFRASRRPLLSGQMEQLALSGSVGPGTKLRRRWGSVFEALASGGEAVLLLGGRELRMPGHALPALRFMAEALGTFTPSDLPGELDEESRLVLARRLVREGALEVPRDVD